MMGDLTNHVWQSTVFAAGAGLLTVAFRRNRAKVRCWLWFSASVKFLAPFALLVSLGSHSGWAPAAREIAAPSVTHTVGQIARPFPRVLPAATAAARRTDWFPAALLGLWAFGFAGVAAMRFRGWLSIRSAVRSSTAVDIAAPVEIRSAPGLLEPGVVGLLRPILLLPEGITERLTPPQLEAVLAHELCHVRRRDNLFASIHMLVEATFWFHPLVWWIGARLIEERERACDEEVLSLGNQPHVYAEGILNVCKLYVESPLVCVSGVSGSDVKKRIEAILLNRLALKLTFVKKAALAALGVVALVAPLVVGTMHAPAMLAQSSPPGNQQPPAQQRAIPEPLGGAGAVTTSPVAAPASIHSTAAPDPANPAEPTPPPDARVPGAVPVDVSTYVIGPEDDLLVRVWEQPELGCTCVVRSDGMITVPLIGEIKAAGLTPLELKQEITDELSAKALNDPQVSVSLVGAHSKKYYLYGQVKSGGMKELIMPTTVLEAIVAAGGFMDFANKRDIVIARGDKRFKFNFDEVMKGENLDQNIPS